MSLSNSSIKQEKSHNFQNKNKYVWFIKKFLYYFGNFIGVVFFSAFSYMLILNIISSTVLSKFLYVKTSSENTLFIEAKQKYLAEAFHSIEANQWHKKIVLSFKYAISVCWSLITKFTIDVGHSYPVVGTNISHTCIGWIKSINKQHNIFKISTIFTILLLLCDVVFSFGILSILLWSRKKNTTIKKTLFNTIYFIFSVFRQIPFIILIKIFKILINKIFNIDNVSFNINTNIYWKLEVLFLFLSIKNMSNTIINWYNRIIIMEQNSKTAYLNYSKYLNISDFIINTKYIGIELILNYLKHLPNKTISLFVSTYYLKSIFDQSEGTKIFLTIGGVCSTISDIRSNYFEPEVLVYILLRFTVTFIIVEIICDALIKYICEQGFPSITKYKIKHLYE